MNERWLVASLHLLALAIGFGAIHGRSRALRRPLDDAGIGRVLSADTGWGVAGLLWLVTGLLRAFTPLEKGALYYLQNPLFHAKLGLFVLILLLEIAPMVTFIGWRMRRGRGESVDTSRAKTFAIISDIQTLFVLVILFLATAIARGFGGNVSP